MKKRNDPPRAKSGLCQIEVFTRDYLIQFLHQLGIDSPTEANHLSLENIIYYTVLMPLLIRP